MRKSEKKGPNSKSPRCPIFKFFVVTREVIFPKMAPILDPVNFFGVFSLLGPCVKSWSNFSFKILTKSLKISTKLLPQNLGASQHCRCPSKGHQLPLSSYPHRQELYQSSLNIDLFLTNSYLTSTQCFEANPILADHSQTVWDFTGAPPWGRRFQALSYHFRSTAKLFTSLTA